MSYVRSYEFHPNRLPCWEAEKLNDPLKAHEQINIRLESAEQGDRFEIMAIKYAMRAKSVNYKKANDTENAEAFDNVYQAAARAEVAVIKILKDKEWERTPITEKFLGFILQPLMNAHVFLDDCVTRYTDRAKVEAIEIKFHWER